MRRRRYSSSASETFGGLVFLLSILTLVFSLVQACSEQFSSEPQASGSTRWAWSEWGAVQKVGREIVPDISNRPATLKT